MNTIENIARICALGLMVSAANAETVKFKDWPDNPTHNWSDTSSWEGGVAPGAGDDVLFDYGQYMVITDSFTIKSFAVNNTSWNPGGIRTISGDTPPDLSAWKAPSLNILEDVNISAAENTLGAEYTFTFGSANYRRGFNQISVGGNFLYKGYGVLTFGFAPNVEYSRDHYSLDIGGILTASVGEDWGNWSYKRRIIINKCGNDNSAASETVDAFVRLGGLAGGGIISNNDPGALSTTIVFQARSGKAFSGGDFSGRFTKFWGAENSTMKIIMDAGSGSAQQSIRLINRYGDSSDADLNSLEFEVQSGTLGLSTNKADGIKIDGVSLIGGTLKVVEAADHLDVRDNGHGGVYEAQSLKGDLNIGISAVTGSNLDTYTQADSLRTEDADELSLASESALFNASKHKNDNGGYDVVLNRRAFNEFTENASLGQYLEQNYQEGNLTELYDSVKSETDDFAVRQNIADKTGFDTMLNFADENFQVLRSLNRSMADTILKPSDEPYRVLAGYDNFNLETDNKGLLSGYELSSNSMYTFGDKRLDNKNRLGLGLSYTNLSSSYEEGGDRDLNIFTVFMPYLHKFSDNLRLASVLSFGYGYGEYDRGSDRESDITDFFYGLTNELRYTIDLNGFAELEPALMLNALGYSEDGFDEGNAEDALITKRTNNLSVEAGIGLFLKKEVKMEKYGKLGFKIGGVYYHEFAEPYDDIRARHNGASGWYSINDYANLYQRDRAVLEAAVDYEYKDIALYAKYNRLIQKNDPQLFDLGIKYKF